VDHEASGASQSRMSEPKRERKQIKVKQTEEQEKNSWEKVQAIRTPQGDNREHFRQPDNTEHHESKSFVAMVKLNEEENHPHHDGTEHKIVNQVPCHQLDDRLPVANMIL
jgi:hypothetical protein